MKQNTRRTLVIVMIILCAILIGVLSDIGWSAFKEYEHPLKYIDIVEKYSAEYGMPKEIILAVIKTESDFDASAVSGAGAIGLMQMMPSTFEWLTGDEHLKEHLTPAMLTDPDVSVRYGTYYLFYLKNKFFPTGDVDWDIIFAAYNGGEGNVTKWLADPTCVDASGKLVNIPFPETRSYVSKVNTAIDTYKKLYSEQFS